jgi:EAL domain-containing protein (putative c-di-GMP-specific phosphodiesterase class I)
MELDRWVLSQACEQLSRWKHTIFSQISLSVNISAITMRDDVTETCQSLLESHNLGPRMLGLEVAEGALKTDDVESRRSFDRIHNYGVPIAVDDYGTGSSSLSYLSDFPFSLILVDGSLVAKVPDDSQACALTDALLHMANNLNIVAVAECVETEQQLEFMVNHRCDQAQGYYFTEPLDILKFEKWVRAYQGMPEFEASAVLLFDSSNSGPSPPGAYRSH